MPPIFMGPIPPGPRVINQTVTIKQSGGGFAQFLMGLFGGLRGGAMPGMMYPTVATPYFPAYTAPSLFMQNPMMPMQYPMMPQMPYPMMNQMSPYAYLNQQQVPQLPGTNSEPKSLEMQNLEDFFGDKGYMIRQESGNKFTVVNKDGDLLARGTYEEVRDRLFEINKEAIEESEEIDEAEGDEDIDDEGDDDEAISPRTQKIPSGWHNASADNYKYLKSVDVNAVNKEAKREGQSAARFVVSHLYLPSRLQGCLSMKQINALTQEMISYNKDCFNEDGSFKEGFSSENLALPSTKWVMKYIVGREDMTAGGLQHAVKTHKTKNGNLQYNANLMAQNNYRETYAKDVYYNNKTKTHIFYFSEIKRVVSLPEVKVIDSKGNWKDKDGNVHTRAELETLAEERLEETASSSNNHNDDTVPDDNGSSDNTNLFVEEDEY